MCIALIHALKHSIVPIERAFEDIWPRANRMNLLDDSLSVDLARDGVITEQMTERFLMLGRYAKNAGADGILFTCSAFGPCIDAVVDDLGPMPVLKPNEAMIDEVRQIGGRIGLLATFGPTLRSMPAEFPPDIHLFPRLAEGALAALDNVDVDEHDRVAVAAAQQSLRNTNAIVLAQFSLARSASAIGAATKLPVLTTPESAVRKLKRLFGH